MEHTECSKTSAQKIQTLGNHQKIKNTTKYILFIIYYCSPACFGRFCGHQQRIVREYKQCTDKQMHKMDNNLSIENKFLIYKIILKPIRTYGIPLWGTASNSNIEILQRYQNKILRAIANAPWYTGVHRRNGQNFGRVFLMLNYTDITQNTYIQS